MKISNELSDKIQKAIDEFVADSEPFLINFDEVYDLRKIAKELNVLPLLGNFGHNWGLNTDGEVVCFPYDDLKKIEVIGEDQKHFRNMRRRAFLVASREYPYLTELKPVRPNNAQTCKDCKGTGREPINDVLGYEERIVCICGGLGWLPKDESYEITISNLDEFFPDGIDKK